MKNSIILNNDQINHITKRIAFQILENNAEEKEIILAGISGQGFVFASRIQKVLHSISDIDIQLCKVTIDKKNPLSEVSTSLEVKEYENKPLVLIDDVLNSGTTLIYGIKHFLDVPLKRFKTAVLVNRNHKKYPVKADFKGISLATTSLDNITVEFSDNESVAYLD